MDAALFQAEMLTLLAREGCAYAIEVGFWKWVGLKVRRTLRMSRLGCGG